MNRIPLINSLLAFTPQAHWFTVKKFALLWFLSTSPLIVSILLSSHPTGEVGLREFVAQARAALVDTDLYIYTASFISPLVLLVFEKYLLIEPGTDKPFRTSWRELFPGYGWLLLAGIVVLVLALIGFSASRLESGPGSANTWVALLISKGFTCLYVTSLVCWYFSILESAPFDKPSYTQIARESENAKVRSFAERMKNKGSQND